MPKKAKSKKTVEAVESRGILEEIFAYFQSNEEMSLNVKKIVVALLSVIFFITLLIVAWIEGGRKRILEYPGAVVTAENADCVACHQTTTPGLVKQWKESLHSQSGIGCYNCHGSAEGEPDAFEHNGKFISIIVSPKDCSTCHEKQGKEFAASHHSRGGMILGSLDNILAEVVEGTAEYNAQGERIKNSPAAVSGCQQCHGSEVKVLSDGRLDPETWPNSGIGRINPDGSKGACSACHLRHNFSIAQVRQPESCGRCHMGPDHPHLEIYMESKHGIAFVANREKMVKQMADKEWLPGRDFEAGPTCSTCHMGPTPELESTHDVGARISWNLRPAISERIDAAAKRRNESVRPWEERRKEMQQVCQQCHSPGWIENWYVQFDNFIELYNNKFARPATELYNQIRDRGLITKDVTFDDKIEFTYFYLWHHEGRRARHGASMMGPDYTQWHGMFEVAENFYQKFIPELKEIIEKGKRAGGGRAQAALAVEKRMNEILNSQHHRWYLGKMPPGEKAARARARAKFLERYGRSKN